ncbi:MAG: MFS transporter [Acidobacteriota bacterium]
MSRLGYRHLLKQNRNLKSLWISQIISELGDWFNNIAVLALTMHLTGSGLVVTAILLSRTIPTIFFGLPAGIITDRFSRRTVLLAADYSRAVLALGFLLVRSRGDMWMAYFFSALLTAVSIFFTTAKNSSIPEITTSGQLMPANALTGSTTAIMQMVGGALGGFATHWFGYQTAFLLNALSFLASAALIYRIRFQPAQPTHHEPLRSPRAFCHDFVEGMRFIRGNPIVLGLLLIGMGWATGGGAAQILFSLFAIDVYHAGDQAIGFLYSAAGLGIVVGSTIANLYFQTQSFRLTKWVIGASMLLTGIFYGIFSFTHWIGSGVLWIALSRIMMGINNVIGTTLLMQTVPNQFRGRTFSTKETVVISTMVVSMLLAGVGQHYVGTRTIALVAGVLTALTGVVWLAANLAGVYRDERVSASRSVATIEEHG